MKLTKIGNYKLLSSTNENCDIITGKTVELGVDKANQLYAVSEGKCIWATTPIKSSKKVKTDYTFQTQNSVYVFREVATAKKPEWKSVMDAIREFDKKIAETSREAYAKIQADYEAACIRLGIE